MYPVQIEDRVSEVQQLMQQLGTATAKSRDRAAVQKCNPVNSATMKRSVKIRLEVFTPTGTHESETFSVSIGTESLPMLAI